MKSDFEDYLTDAKLHIETTGRDESCADPHIYPYEATSYTVLDRQIGSGLIRKNDCLLDYGCGKGRVPIYVSHHTDVAPSVLNILKSSIIRHCLIFYLTGNSSPIISRTSGLCKHPPLHMTCHPG